MKSKFPIFAAVVALSVLAICLAFTMGAAIGSNKSIEFWFNRYQTFLAAIIAIGAATIAAVPVFRQLSENQLQTKIQAFEALYQISFRLKQCELAATRLATASHRFVATEMTMAPLAEATIPALKSMCVEVEKVEKSLEFEIEKIAELDSFQLKPMSPALSSALILCGQLKLKSIRFRVTAEDTIAALIGNKDRAAAAAGFAALKGWSCRAEIATALEAIDRYKSEIREGLVLARAQLGRFDFTS